MNVAALKSIVKSFLKCIPIQNNILFESYPDFSDSTLSVFQEFLKRAYNKKYRLIWICNSESSDMSTISSIHNVYGISIKKHPVLYQFLVYTSRVTICCNNFIGSDRDKQDSYYICHGMPLKDTRNYYSPPDFIDYFISPSDYMTPLLAYALRKPGRCFRTLGFPRNDVLNTPTIKLNSYFGGYSKYFVWYPTFRQVKNKSGLCGSNDSLPIIHDEKAARKINDVAKANDVLLILKPHFAQDTSYVKDLSLSNIRFIDDTFFSKNGITSYQLVGACDALLSDYSSIYYDYLLCDKPIGLIWEDINEYKKNPGLIKDYEYLCSGGKKIYTVDDLSNFITNVAKGYDELKTERNIICDLVHMSRDGKNTERVTDFIIENSHLRNKR